MVEPHRRSGRRDSTGEASTQRQAHPLVHLLLQPSGGAGDERRSRRVEEQDRHRVDVEQAFDPVDQLVQQFFGVEMDQRGICQRLQPPTVARSSRPTQSPRTDNLDARDRRRAVIAGRPRRPSRLRTRSSIACRVHCAARLRTSIAIQARTMQTTRPPRNAEFWLMVRRTVRRGCRTAVIKIGESPHQVHQAGDTLRAGRRTLATVARRRGSVVERPHSARWGRSASAGSPVPRSVRGRSRTFEYQPGSRLPGDLSPRQGEG